MYMTVHYMLIHVHVQYMTVNIHDNNMYSYTCITVHLHLHSGTWLYKTIHVHDGLTVHVHDDNVHDGCVGVTDWLLALTLTLEILLSIRLVHVHHNILALTNSGIRSSIHSSLLRVSPSFPCDTDIIHYAFLFTGIYWLAFIIKSHCWLKACRWHVTCASRKWRKMYVHVHIHSYCKPVTSNTKRQKGTCDT